MLALNRASAIVPVMIPAPSTLVALPAVTAVVAFAARKAYGAGARRKRGARVASTPAVMPFTVISRYRSEAVALSNTVERLFRVSPMFTPSPSRTLKLPLSTVTVCCSVQSRLAVEALAASFQMRKTKS